MNFLTSVGAIAFCAAIFSSCTSPAATKVATTSTKKSPSHVSSTKKAAKPFYPQSPSQTTKDKAAGLKKDKHGLPTYTAETRKRWVRSTAYSHQENEPGAPGRMNAAGTILKYGSKVRSAAADWSLYPLGTKFKIKGLPYTYVVDDYGSALVGTNTVDIYHPTLKSMRKWGTRGIEIQVIQWGSVERSLALLKGRRRYSHCNSMFVNLSRRARSFQTASR